MRTESQQTNTSNFTHKNKHKISYALHHTLFFTERNANIKRGIKIVSASI